jgi:hypothetical protein
MFEGLGGAMFDAMVPAGRVKGMAGASGWPVPVLGWVGELVYGDGAARGDSLRRESRYNPKVLPAAQRRAWHNMVRDLSSTWPLMEGWYHAWPYR